MADDSDLIRKQPDPRALFRGDGSMPRSPGMHDVLAPATIVPAGAEDRVAESQAKDADDPEPQAKDDDNGQVSELAGALREFTKELRSIVESLKGKPSDKPASSDAAKRDDAGGEPKAAKGIFGGAMDRLKGLFAPDKPAGDNAPRQTESTVVEPTAPTPATPQQRAGEPAAQSPQRADEPKQADAPQQAPQDTPRVKSAMQPMGQVEREAAEEAAPRAQADRKRRDAKRAKIDAEIDRIKAAERDPQGFSGEEDRKEGVRAKRISALERERKKLGPAEGDKPPEAATAGNKDKPADKTGPTPQTDAKPAGAGDGGVVEAIKALLDIARAQHEEQKKANEHLEGLITAVASIDMNPALGGS